MSEQVRCSEAVEKLWELLDQELDEGQCERVRAHLEQCRSCFPHYDFHRAYRAFVASCAKEPAPAELRRKIFLSLLAEENNG